ncbi:hypothetical protein [Methylobacterium sp. J-067]|uniref:hypothetical protein n=1 Tax=Methylobacterium sp. J-067 TaxID=2836648 RepID=UPI001FBA7DE7|nr:hypothetical protein [Methylobacterium sp. J-067]MCJ2023244.1 hypothetical protein [Methylobacterium sp. J-067]
MVAPTLFITLPSLAALVALPVEGEVVGVHEPPVPVEEGPGTVLSGVDAEVHQCTFRVEA